MERVQKRRETRDTILIITNGDTEKNYFNSITSCFSTMFSIKVDKQNSQCDEMVEYAIKLKSAKYNQIWCVFDIDETYIEGHLIKAISMAKKYGINYAYSNECFEVWLIYHLNNTVKETLTRKTYINEINQLLKRLGVATDYKKNDLELIRNIFIPYIFEATQNAKRKCQLLEVEYQKRYGNTNYDIWNWKSITTVYKLIENMQLSYKNKKQI